MYISRTLIENLINLEKVSNNKIVEVLNNCGLETEIVHDYRILNNKLKVAKILKKEKHPILTELNIVKVDDGNNILTIICGANNFETNDKVILAPLGTKLGPQIIIKKRKFADIYSEGMLCAWEELNLPDLGKEKGSIALLPKNAQIGTNPLKYVFFDDCLFKMQHPWNQNDGALLYLAGQYLVKHLQTTWKKNHNYQNQILNIQDNDFFAYIQVPLNKNYQLLPMIKNQLLLHKIELSNNWFDNLAKYIHLESGIKPEGVFTIKNIIDDKKTTLIKDLWTKNQKNHLENIKEAKYLNIFINKKNNKHLMPLFHELAFQRTIFWIKQHIDQAKISSYVDSSIQKKQQTMTIKIEIINSIMGTDLKLNDLEKILTATPLIIKKKDQTQISFLLPESHYWKNQNEVIGEIMKYYGIDNIKPQAIYPQKIKKNRNQIIRYLIDLNKYLLQLGLKRIKSFVFNQEKTNNSISVINSNKKINLQTSLIPNLIPFANKNQTSVFSIDKIFQKNNNKYEEFLQMGIIWKNPWIKNSILQEKIQINSSFIMSVVQNILQIYEIQSVKLDKTIHFWKKLQKIIINKNGDDFLINSKDSEIIYYQQQPIGQWGMQKINDKISDKNWFYLEINLTTLWKIKKKDQMKIIFQPKSENIKLVFQDFSIKISKPWKDEILVGEKYEKIWKTNYFEYLIYKISNCDKTIKKMEIIDVFEGTKCTIRVWKEKKITDKIKDKVLFEELEKKLKALKNVKILDK